MNTNPACKLSLSIPMIWTGLCDFCPLIKKKVCFPPFKHRLSTNAFLFRRMIPEFECLSFDAAFIVLLFGFLVESQLMTDSLTAACISLSCSQCYMQVILNDPFLGKRVEEGSYTTVPLRDEFLENARLFICETYCRIHQRIDLGYVYIL